MMMIWYTRDSNGDRTLWLEEPSKNYYGDWELYGSSWSVIASDFNAEEGAIDALLGKGVHGLRKGEKVGIEVSWRKS